MLGRDQTGDSAAQRLERFVAIYPQSLAPLERRHLAVDLRYPNGFAVRLPEQAMKAGSA